MNIYATDIMTFFFILLCCLCTFLLILLAFIVYILGSARVRSAFIAFGLFKTVIDVVKDVVSAFKTVKGSSSKMKNTAKKTTNSGPILDVEFREKKSKN